MKKITYTITSIAIAIIFTFSFSVFAEDTEKAADSIAKKASFSIDGNKVGLGSLYDEKLDTVYKTEKQEIIKIKSEEKIAALYVVFQRPPEFWNLSYEMQTSPCGTSGFLHELVNVTIPQNELFLTFEANAEICEIYVFTKGELPPFVEQWQPANDSADLLLFPTNAGDEFITFGGILPYYANDNSKKIQLAYLTNSYDDGIIAHEQLAALWNAGVRNYPIIPKFKNNNSKTLDEAKSLFDIDAMINYQADIIRKLTPKVVVAHDIKNAKTGMDMLNADVFLQALTLAESSPKDSITTNYDGFNVPKVYFDSDDENNTLLSYDLPLQSFDGKTAEAVASDSLSLYKSAKFKANPQNKGSFDLFKTLVSEDSKKNDLFENELAIDALLQQIEVDKKAESSITSSSVSSGTASSKPAVSSDSPKEETDPSKGMQGPLFVIAGVLILIMTLKHYGKNKRNKMKEMGLIK